MTSTTESNPVPNNSRAFYRYIFSPESEGIADVDEQLLEMPGIYCILNTELNTLYIGSSLNVYKRIRTHLSCLESCTHTCKKMNLQYRKNPDAFMFFAVEYFTLSEYTLTESKRVALLNIEMQYMKRVPRARLYNVVTPASLSERLLAFENVKGESRIPIVDICNRIEMSADSIRANGFNTWDKLTVAESIDFVQKRTVANGRWPEDKAEKARIYLMELQSLSNGSYNEDQVKRALSEFGEFDYFDGLTALTPIKRIDWETIAVLGGPLAISLFSVCLTIVGLTIFAGWAGALLGGMFALFLFSTIIVARNREKGDTSMTALQTVLRMETGAAALHCFTFHELLPDFPPAWWWAQVVASVALAAFAAHLSYQAVLKVRNYNAEIIQNQDNG